MSTRSQGQSLWKLSVTFAAGSSAPPLQQDLAGRGVGVGSPWSGPRIVNLSMTSISATVLEARDREPVSQGRLRN